MALEGLLQFDNAESDLQPEMLVALPWDNVRRFLWSMGRYREEIGSRNRWMIYLSKPPIQSRSPSVPMAATRAGCCLPEVWQRYPNHLVLVLTDGEGNLPAYIPNSCRARTSALLIGLENYNDDQREEILAVSEAIAGKVVEVPSLDDLAGVWATLIPRRQVA